MKEIKRNLYREMLIIALPITIQSLFQASLSIIDQIMVGSLGKISIAGIGLGSKFASIFSVTVAALCSATGILISQYYGSKDTKGIKDSFSINMLFALGISVLFIVLSLGSSYKLMGLYSTDQAVIAAGAKYLRILAIGFIPLTITLMFSTLLRSIGFAKIPMYASVIAVIANTALNYGLIFGKLGCPQLGLVGAAIATTMARIIEMIILLIYFIKVKNTYKFSAKMEFKYTKGFIKKVWQIIYPLLITEFLWSLGENMYATIYGRLGADACAAMTLTGPVQSLVIGMFTGVSAATGIMIGNKLGANEMEPAYDAGKEFMKIGLWGTLCFSVLVVIFAPLYSMIFNVEHEVRQITIRILWAYAVIVPVKVLNMIGGGGILRSGGKTHYTLALDLVGTWLIGVPVGMVSAYILRLPIEKVYFLLSLEEVFRLIMLLIVFRTRKWMSNLTNKA